MPTMETKTLERVTMGIVKRMILEEMERQVLKDQLYHDDEMPWVPGKIIRMLDEPQTCAMCGGEISRKVTGETAVGENIHECLDCGAKHRALMARPFRGKECRPNRNNFRGVI